MHQRGEARILPCLVSGRGARTGRASSNEPGPRPPRRRRRPTRVDRATLITRPRDALGAGAVYTEPGEVLPYGYDAGIEHHSPG